MKKLLLIIFIFFLQIGVSDVCVAQSQYNIDSLLNALKTANEDTGKVKTLNHLSGQLRTNNDFKAAKQYSDTALLLSEKLNFKSGKFLAYNGLGIVDRELGNYTDALINFNAALKIAEEPENEKNVSTVYTNMGLLYWNEGNYPEALKLYFNGLEIDEKLNDSGSIAIDYADIGDIYVTQGNYPEALKFYSSSVKIFNKLKDDHSLATLYNNIGDIYVYQKNYGEGIKNILASLNSFQKFDDKEGIAMTYCNLGEIYYDQQDYTDALKNNMSCLKIAQETGIKRLLIASLKNIGAVYIAQKKFIEAEKYLDDGLDSAKEIGLKDLIEDIYKTKVTLDSTVGNYKNEYEDFKRYTIYKDSLFNEANDKQIEEIKDKYETAKKDNEITLLIKNKEIQNEELKRQKLIKNYFIGGIIALLLLFILFYNYYRTKQLLKLQTLRNRIASDLHDDVGSTLSSISIFSELAKEQSKEVIPMLESIGESSRKMLESMADIVWTVNPENDNFEKIILRMRSFAFELLGAKKIDFEFDADDAVAKMKLPMDVRKNLYLIFKEAINNIVKYADADRAYFSISGEKNNLTMLIRDNGKGFDATQLSQGNGLANMKKRADEIGAKLLIESGTGIGTTIQFLLKIA